MPPHVRKAPALESSKPSVALAYADLTRMAYFGPAVFSVFLLGAVLAMPEGPHWGALFRVVLLGVVGFSGGFVLNDWADREPDRAMLAAGIRDPQYGRQLRRERPFTGTRPIAAGIVSPHAGLVFALALIVTSALTALTFPAPHRWYLLTIIGASTVLEPLYCLVKQRQRRFPFATFISAYLVGICPPTGYLAIRRPDLTALLLLASVYLWEFGFNQLYDTVDVDNDRRRGVTTLSTLLGLRFVAAWCVALSTLTTLAFLELWHVTHSGPAMLIGICAAAALLLGTDIRFLLRPTPAVSRPAITVHQVFLMLVVAATVADAALRWRRVY